MDIDELIANDPTDDNRFANALQELRQQAAENEKVIEAANETIKEKSEAIQKLKASNFDLLNKLTVEEKKPIINKEVRSTEEVLKDIYK